VDRGKYAWNSKYNGDWTQELNLDRAWDGVNGEGVNDEGVNDEGVNGEGVNGERMNGDVVNCEGEQGEERDVNRARIENEEVEAESMVEKKTNVSSSKDLEDVEHTGVFVDMTPSSDVCLLSKTSFLALGNSGLRHVAKTLLFDESESGTQVTESSLNESQNASGLHYLTSAHCTMSEIGYACDPNAHVKCGCHTRVNAFFFCFSISKKIFRVVDPMVGLSLHAAQSANCGVRMRRTKTILPQNGVFILVALTANESVGKRRVNGVKKGKSWKKEAKIKK
jgi:hypothetical protein